MREILSESTANRSWNDYSDDELLALEGHILDAVNSPLLTLEQMEATLNLWNMRSIRYARECDRRREKFLTRMKEEKAARAKDAAKDFKQPTRRDMPKYEDWETYSDLKI